MSDLFRPIIGIENRTGEEAFAIMRDRLRPEINAIRAENMVLREALEKIAGKNDLSGVPDEDV
jgi:hypothetical protein